LVWQCGFIFGVIGKHMDTEDQGAPDAPKRGTLRRGTFATEKERGTTAY